MTDKYDGACFIHFQDVTRTSPHLGGATVAYKELDNGYIAVGISLCHASDRFTKHYGRAKAFGRLQQLLLNRDLKSSTYFDVATQSVFPDTESVIRHMNAQAYVLRGVDTSGRSGV